MKQVMPTLLVVIVIIPIDNRFVVVEETKESCRGKWALPGGLVEWGESLTDAAVREAWEEASIKVVPRGILAIEQITYQSPGENPYAQKFRYIVVADALSKDVKETPDRESLRAELLTQDEIKQLELREPRYADWVDVFQSGKTLLPIEAFSFHRTA